MTMYRAMFGRLTRGCPSYEFPKFECDDDSDPVLQRLAREALREKLEAVQDSDWDLITVERVVGDP